jgi:hypothetical protein
MTQAGLVREPIHFISRRMRSLAEGRDSLQNDLLTLQMARIPVS